MQEIKEYICQNPERLDTFLSEEIGETRSQVAQLIKLGAVLVENKKTARAGLKLKARQRVRVTFPQMQEEKGSKIDFLAEVS